MRSTLDKLKKEHESVWDCPHPPRSETVSRIIRIYFNSILIAETRAAVRVLETSHPPVFYIPLQDIQMKCLQKAHELSWCEWKGRAFYYNVIVGNRIAKRAAWSYPDPNPRFINTKEHVAFYAGKMDACYIDDESVQPQPGEFYGGWITKDIMGLFNGIPGS